MTLLLSFEYKSTIKPMGKLVIYRIITLHHLGLLTGPMKPNEFNSQTFQPRLFDRFNSPSPPEFQSCFTPTPLAFFSPLNLIFFFFWRYFKIIFDYQYKKKKTPFIPLLFLCLCWSLFVFIFMQNIRGQKYLNALK